MAESGPVAESIPPPSEERETSVSDRSIVVRSQSQSSGFFSKFRYHLFAAGFAFLLSPLAFIWTGQSPVDPTNYAERTRRVLKTTPSVTIHAGLEVLVNISYSLIDGHNDLPWQLRIELHNRIYDGRVDLEKRLLGHTDLQRMRAGMVGGQFWSVYVHCDTQQRHFEDPSVSESRVKRRGHMAKDHTTNMNDSGS